MPGYYFGFDVNTKQLGDSKLDLKNCSDGFITEHLSTFTDKTDGMHVEVSHTLFKGLPEALFEGKPEYGGSKAAAKAMLKAERKAAKVKEDEERGRASSPSIFSCPPPAQFAAQICVIAGHLPLLPCPPFALPHSRADSVLLLRVLARRVRAAAKAREEALTREGAAKLERALSEKKVKAEQEQAVKKEEEASASVAGTAEEGDAGESAGGDAEAAAVAAALRTKRKAAAVDVELEVGETVVLTPQVPGQQVGEHAHGVAAGGAAAGGASVPKKKKPKIALGRKKR